jgi:hypothetical protein
MIRDTTFSEGQIVNNKESIRKILGLDTLRKLTILSLSILIPFLLINSVSLPPLQCQTNTLMYRSGSQAEIQTDLECILFESWWAALNNGTLYIRYLVNNTGASYHNPIQPITLNISFFIDNQTTEYAYVNQTSFIDPYTWYTGETIGGCIQINVSEKPKQITAHINPKQIIPEGNMSNNINRTRVYNGIIISGVVTKETESEQDMILPKVTIKQCDPDSLQSSLYIRFNTDQNGSYIVSLYPKQPLTSPHQYDLIFTDINTSRRIHAITEPVFYNDTTTIDVIFTDNPPTKPIKPIGCIIGIQNKTNIFFTRTKGFDDIMVSYKFKWDGNEYSDWFGPYSSYRLVYSRNLWAEKGIHQLKVIAKDNFGQLSNWSESKFVYII